MNDWLNLIWPLCFVLVLLFVLRKVGEDVRPIVASMASGLATGAQKNATQYAIALGFGLSASLAAFYDVFSAMGNEAWAQMNWHQYAALWAKVANPFVVAVLAYVTQSNFKPGGTQPPFPKP
jgi:hypothetical protein